MDVAPPQPGELALAAAPVAAAGEAAIPSVLRSLDAPPAISPRLLNELAKAAALAEVGLTPHEFSAALTAVGAKYHYGLPPEAAVTLAAQEKFYRALQLPDFALAQACALGREPAWQRFMDRFRAPLRQAAIAITGSSSLGEELADSLYAELFGLSERDGQRRSPLAGYSGRGSLMGWLRTTLAQRHVDHHRRTHREAPLPEHETVADIVPAFAAQPAEAPPDAAQLTQLTGALTQVIAALDPEDRFLLSAYFLDQHTLLEISRLLRVHEATVSRKLKRLTAEVQKQLLKRLQAVGLSKRAAQEALGADPRDLTLNLRSLLQPSPSTTFLNQRGQS